MFAIITGIPSRSLCGGERRGAPERETRNDWGCGSSGLALFAGSHRSPLENNGSLEPTLCQEVAVPSAFFVFSPGGRVLPRTLSYLLSTPLFWVFTQTPIPISLSDQNNFIFNIVLSWICISGHFGSSSDKDDRLIAILLDHFRPVCPDTILISRIFKKVLRLGVSQSRCTQVFFEMGLLPCPTIEERVSLVDTTKVDSLLLIPQSPLAVEDLNKSFAVLQPTPYDGYCEFHKLNPD